MIQETFDFYVAHALTLGKKRSCSRGRPAYCNDHLQSYDISEIQCMAPYMAALEVMKQF